MSGHVVISLGLFGHADEPTGARFLTSDGDETRPEKTALDQLHFRKIDLADAIFVVNVGGYIGSSTKREIEYARSRGKAVEWMFPTNDPAASGDSVYFDFRAHLQRQREFSERTFGPGRRTAGVCDHIRKELKEIEQAPDDIDEWIDVVILGLDGAWRAGASPQQIIERIVAKQTKNEGRNWPDWRTADPTKAIEHERAGEADPGAPFKLNQWIDDEIEKMMVSPLYFSPHQREQIGELARGAAIHVINDVETLIGNLRAAGYTVTPPQDVNHRETVTLPDGWIVENYILIVDDTFNPHATYRDMGLRAKAFAAYPKVRRQNGEILKDEWMKGIASLHSRSQ